MVTKALLLGASGRTGGCILDGLLRRHLSVDALVRDPFKFTPPPTSSPSTLRVVQGSPLNPSDLSNALIGCDAVASALALARTSDSPFGGLTGPPFFMRDTVQATITAMQEGGVKRLVVVSSWGVGDDCPHAPFMFEAILYLTPLRHVFADHDAVDAAVRASGLDWTLARAVGFTSKDTATSVAEFPTSVQLPGMSWIHRRLVGEWVVKALDNSATIHQSLVIAQK